MGDWAAVGGAFDPFGVSFPGFLIHVVAIETRHHAHPFGLGGFGEVAEQVAVPQELAAVMVRDARGIECHDAAGAEQEGVELQAGPIVHPPGDVELDRVALVEIRLAAALHGGVPGTGVIGRAEERGGRQGGSRDYCQKVAAGYGRDAWVGVHTQDVLSANQGCKEAADRGVCKRGARMSEPRNGLNVTSSLRCGSRSRSNSDSSLTRGRHSASRPGWSRQKPGNWLILAQ